MVENIFSALTIAAVAAVFGLFFFAKRKEGKDGLYAIYFITTLVLGTILYAIGLLYKNDVAVSRLYHYCHAFTYALKSFGGDFGGASVSALAKDNSLFRAAIFIHYLAAMLLTFLVAIKLFGKNVANSVKVFVNSFRRKYIVLGATGPAEVFLKSLDGKRRKRTTVILQSKDKNIKKDLMFSGFLVVVAGEDENYKPNNRGGTGKGLYTALRTAGFMRHKRCVKVISMLTADADNLLVAKIITDYVRAAVKPTKDEKGRICRLLAEQETALEKINLSAHIMYTQLDRTEHFAFVEYALGKVRFFNPAEVRARKFVGENPITSLIPKNWINTSKARLYGKRDGEGHKDYKIGNFFVGYGDTNQQLFKKCICNYQLLGTDFYALIFDKEAGRQEMQLRNSCAGLFFKTDGTSGMELQHGSEGGAYFPSPEEKYCIEFVPVDVLSVEFYDRIIAEIRGAEGGEGFDFVSIFIALGSDKQSVETALELRQKLYERGLLKIGNGENPPDRVRIFVKILTNSVLSDCQILNDEKDIDSKIVTFGAECEVLNEEYIINEELDFLAKRIANDYWNNAGADSQKTNVVSKWDALTEFKRESNRNTAMSIRTKLNLLGFELAKCDKPNGTAKSVATAFEEAYDIATAERQRSAKAAGKFVDFAERDPNGYIIDNARNNLARLEHQRWNTLHLASGWTKLPKSQVTANVRQDEKAKQHACITTFEGLTDLRNKQATELTPHQTPPDTALSEADTVCYDFDVMDRAGAHIRDSKYRIERLGR